MQREPVDRRRPVLALSATAAAKLRALVHRTRSPLVAQAAWHVGGRVVSATFSFLLFASIVRLFDDAAAQQVLFAGFALGFVLSTLRLYGQLAAAIRGGERASLRVEGARRGIAGVVLVLPVALPVVAAVLWFRLRSVPLVVVSLLVAGTGAVDGDLLRSALRRGPAFAVLSAVGGGLGLAAVWGYRHSVSAAYAGLLLQWVPIALYNGYMAVRAMRGVRAMARLRGGQSARTTLGLTALATFDGLVLNAPFVSFFTPDRGVGIELALIVRLFVAALPVLPLLFAWANSSALDRIAERYRISSSFAFGLVLVGTGLASGSFYFFAFGLVTGSGSSSVTYFAFVCLLLSYSAYIVTVRFVVAGVYVWKSFPVLGATLAAFAIAFWLLDTRLRTSAAWVSLMQSSALLVAAGTLRWRVRCASGRSADTVR